MTYPEKYAGAILPTQLKFSEYTKTPRQHSLLFIRNAAPDLEFFGPAINWLYSGRSNHLLSGSNGFCEWCRKANIRSFKN
jgi:hypothetical protein